MQRVQRENQEHNPTLWGGKKRLLWNRGDKQAGWMATNGRRPVLQVLCATRRRREESKEDGFPNLCRTPADEHVRDHLHRGERCYDAEQGAKPEGGGGALEHRGILAPFHPTGTTFCMAHHPCHPSPRDQGPPHQAPGNGEEGWQQARGGHLAAQRCERPVRDIRWEQHPSCRSRWPLITTQGEGVWEGGREGEGEEAMDSNHNILQ